MCVSVLTVSAEALGEGGGVGDVIGGVLLWHQGDDGAICHLRIQTHSGDAQSLARAPAVATTCPPARPPARVGPRRT